MSNIATLKPIEKGDGRGGRKPGQTNKHTRALKHALMIAAEKSRHGNGCLAGYCTWLADEKPELYVSMLGRLIPVQAKIKSSDGIPTRLNINMTLSDMVSAFEMKIKSDYRPAVPIIEQEDVEVEQEQNQDEDEDKDE